MMIAEFDLLSEEEKRKIYSECCGSQSWVNSMLQEPPFEDLVALLDAAEKHWFELVPGQWKEAFSHHPRIGEAQGAGSSARALEEQSGVDKNDPQVLDVFASANREYEQKFGNIFIVSASGKSADEILGILTRRMNNTPEEELEIAAEEQFKITRSRLEKYFL